VSAIRDERGFLALQLLSIFLVIALSLFCVLMGTAFGARKVAYCTYQWFGAAMDYATMDANQDGDLRRSRQVPKPAQVTRSW